MSRGKYKMEVERMRFTIAMKDIDEELMAQGATNITLVGAYGKDEGRIEADLTGIDGQKLEGRQSRTPFDAWAVAWWWLGDEWLVRSARVEREGIVGVAEAKRKEDA